MSTKWLRALFALGCVLIAACGPAAAAKGTPTTAHGGVLRIGQNAADLGTLDPHYASGTQDRALVDMIFNGLLRYRPGDATSFEPDLASSLPEPSTGPDGKQLWTFVLRRGVMCHPSDAVPAYELTGEDVVYSLQKASSKQTSAYSSDYAGMAFASPERYTVTVSVDKPLSTALFYPRVANYSGGYILCKQAAEKLGPDGLKTHPVGTGPFIFKSYSPRERVELIANGAYFRGRPRLDGIEYRYMADLSSRELGLRSGQLDVVAGLQDGKWVDQMAGAPNVAVDVFGVGEVSTIYFNTARPPFDNPLVRRAIASALDRDEFLALYGPKVAQKVFSPVPAAFMAGGLTEDELAGRGLDGRFDPYKARALLKAAGLPDGFTFSVVTSEMPAYRVIYESMQAQLARVGVRMEIKVVDHATMHDQIRQDANPVVVYVAFRPTADAYLTQFLHSDAIVVSGKSPNTNFAHYAGVDAQIEAARSEPDPLRQATLWKEAQRRALEDAVAFPIEYTNQVYARASAVDYGHELKSVIQLYPGIDETTRLAR